MSPLKRLFSSSLRVILVLATIVFSTWTFGQYLSKQTPHPAIDTQTWATPTPELKQRKCSQCSAARIAAANAARFNNINTPLHTDHAPLFESTVNQNQLLSFATEAAMSAFTYDFNDYRRHFQQSSTYFTPIGWSNFITALRQSGNLSTVLDNKMLVKAVPTDAPIIISQGQVGGVYAWKVQMPLLVVYRGSGSAHGAAKQNFIITMHIRRVKSSDAARGIAIDDLIAAPRKEQVL